MALEAAITALALLRKKPVCLTSRSISTWLASANDCGFGYLRKSDLVTMLTRTSVDCAESIVAISSSKAFVKSSEHFAFGYICLSRTTMSLARSCFLVAISQSIQPQRHKGHRGDLCDLCASVEKAFRITP